MNVEILPDYQPYEIFDYAMVIWLEYCLLQDSFQCGYWYLVVRSYPA